MFANLIQIGKSKGLKILASITKSVNLKDRVLIEIIDNYGILIKPINDNPRKGWDKAFKEMHMKADDKLIINDELDLDSLTEFVW